MSAHPYQRKALVYIKAPQESDQKAGQHNIAIPQDAVPVAILHTQRLKNAMGVAVRVWLMLQEASTLNTTYYLEYAEGGYVRSLTKLNLIEARQPFKGSISSLST